MLRWKHSTSGHWGLSLHWCGINDTCWNTGVCIFLAVMPVSDNVVFVQWLDWLTGLAYKLSTCGADSMIYQALQSAWRRAAVHARYAGRPLHWMLVEGLVPSSCQGATEGKFNTLAETLNAHVTSIHFQEKFSTLLWDPRRWQRCKQPTDASPLFLSGNSLRVSCLF